MKDLPASVVARVIPAACILVSAAVLYLFRLYGALFWWWTQLQRQEHSQRGNLPSFLGIADQIHGLVICLSVLNLVVGLVMWRSGIFHRSLSLLAAIVAAAVLFICTFVNV